MYVVTVAMPPSETPLKASRQETVMKRMKKTLHGVRGPRTWGELVTLAYDVTPNRATAVKLLSALLASRVVHFGRK